MEWLKQCKGVIQIGAHKGQEMKIFKHYPQLNCVFVEALPNVYETLKGRASCNPKYIAINEVVTNEDGKLIEFHVSNNRGGQSSSIFEFKDHSKVWSNVVMVGKIKLTSITLPSIITKYHLEIDNYDVLFMDTQGSELLILEGSKGILEHFKYVHMEVWDFEAYKGCAQYKDILVFMDKYGFVEHSKDKAVYTPLVGSTWNQTFIRK